MKHYLMTLSGKRAVLMGVTAVVVLFILFFILFTTKVSADSGSLSSIQGYEQVLIRPGDTLDTLAHRYYKDYSHISFSEYKNQIIQLNDLESEYIREGIYLMMPICREDINHPRRGF
ncbi:MAG: hypothetical protein VZQ83_02400 [Eubacterium sp.]|nr:hypothetical protein [Eubacterium sp.]